MTINDKIKQLEDQINLLESKIKDLSANTEEKFRKPSTISGNVRSPSFNYPVDTKAGMGGSLGNGVIWNDSELKIPRIDQEPAAPTKGYNKHSHSRYSGGALIKDMLEIVEYNWGAIVNKHSQQFLDLTDADILTVVNSNGQTVRKIGTLDLVFNADTETWGVAAYEIDVKKTYFVERDINGDVALDSKGQQKKSYLYNSDTNKTSIVWDENAQCFRFYAIYAPGE